MTPDPGKRWLELAETAIAATWKQSGGQLVALGITRPRLQELAIERTLKRVEGLPEAHREAAFREAIEKAALFDLGLAAAWAEGSEAAWRSYQDHYRGLVLAAARRQGADRSLAEELADELPGWLLSAPANGTASPLARFDGSGSLEGWLCTLARRRTADRLRPRRERSMEGEAAELELREREGTEQLDPDEQQALRKAAEALRQSLTTRERLVLLLKHEQGLPGRTIARQLGVSDSRVTRLLQHALEKVRARLTPSHTPHPQLPTVLLEALGSSAEDTATHLADS